MRTTLTAVAIHAAPFVLALWAAAAVTDQSVKTCSATGVSQAACLERHRMR